MISYLIRQRFHGVMNSFCMNQLLPIHGCHQISEKKWSNGGRVYFNSHLWGVQSIMVGKAKGVRAASSVVLMRTKRKRNAGTQLVFSFSPFYLDWDLIPRGGVLPTLKPCSVPSVDPLWKHPHRKMHLTSYSDWWWRLDITLNRTLVVNTGSAQSRQKRNVLWRWNNL